MLLQNIAVVGAPVEPVSLAASRPYASAAQPVVPVQALATRPSTAADHTSYYLQVCFVYCIGVFQPVVWAISTMSDRCSCASGAAAMPVTGGV